MARRQNLALVWDNFGPLHDDRLRACVTNFGVQKVIGVEITGRSDTYSWKNIRDDGLPKVTVFADRTLYDVSDFEMFFGVIRVLLKHRASIVFLCHYERIGTLLLALALRLLGRRVYVMGCAKFDDRPRRANREFLKQLFLSPYMGALVGSPGTRDYFGFLGLRRRPIAFGYNTVSNDRIRQLAGADARAGDIPFAQRDFVVVARLVPKKNIATAIRAYARYIDDNPETLRRLRICGNGPQEDELRALVSELGLSGRVVFEGFVQSDQVARILAQSLALVLISTEEQFGNVVPEALSLGIPLVLSDVCGARYELLHSGVNGFLVEPENVAGIAYYMSELSRSEGLWRRLSEAAFETSPLGDAARFAEGVEALIA